MIRDTSLIASDAQAITVTAVSSNSIDLTVSYSIGRATVDMRARVQTVAGFTAGGAGTLLVELIQSANADLSSPDSLYTANGGVAYALAGLGANTALMDIVVPRTSKEYIGFRFTVATGPMTAGSLNAELLVNTPTPEADRVKPYTGI